MSCFNYFRRSKMMTLQGQKMIMKGHLLYYSTCTIYACYHYLHDLVSFYLNTSIAHKTGGPHRQSQHFLVRCETGGPLCHCQKFLIKRCKITFKREGGIHALPISK